MRHRETVSHNNLKINLNTCKYRIDISLPLVQLGQTVPYTWLSVQQVHLNNSREIRYFMAKASLLRLVFFVIHHHMLPTILLLLDNVFLFIFDNFLTYFFDNSLMASVLIFQWKCKKWERQSWQIVWVRMRNLTIAPTIYLPLSLACQTEAIR